MNPLFEMQWNAIRQTQQLAAQSIDAHCRATESFVQLGLDASLDAQRLGTELTRHWLDASVRSLDQPYGSPDSERPMDASSDRLRNRANPVDRWFAALFAMECETVHLLGAAVRPWLTGPPAPAVGGRRAENAITAPATTAATETTAMATTTDTAERPADEATDAESLTLQYISGIGTAYEDRLESVGITSVEALADADPEELASRASLPEKRVREWIRQAEQRVQGV